LKQIAHGRRLIMPVGTSDDQNLVLVQKGDVSTVTDEILPVRFSRLVVPH